MSREGGWSVRSLATQMRCWQVDSKTGGWMAMQMCVL